MSIRATKQAMREAWDYLAMKAMLASADAVEGPVAFAEKRLTRWSGY